MSEYKEYLEDLRDHLLYTVACCYPDINCKKCKKTHQAARVIQGNINDHEKEEN